MKYKPLFLFYLLLSLILGSCIIVPVRIGSGGFGESKIKPAKLSTIEKAVLHEVNYARTNPRGYALKLKRFLSYYNGHIVSLPGKTAIRTNEGESAVKEAIKFLIRQSPVNPFEASQGLTKAARDHVSDTGPKGLLGHRGSNSTMPQDRMNRHGQWLITAGENIGYGFKKAEYIVIQLIVDDGVPGRGHRTNLFKEDFKYVGIGFGYHRRFRYMCVMDFAGGYIDKGI